jgi:hypothetical protein
MEEIHSSIANGRMLSTRLSRELEQLECEQQYHRKQQPVSAQEHGIEIPCVTNNAEGGHVCRKQSSVTLHSMPTNQIRSCYHGDSGVGHDTILIRSHGRQMNGPRRSTLVIRPVIADGTAEIWRASQGCLPRCQGSGDILRAEGSVPPSLRFAALIESVAPRWQ